MIAHDIATVRAEMERRPHGLVEHAQRVVREARPLARRWGVDPRRAELAAWGHDLFRGHSDAELVDLAARMDIPIGAADRDSPVLLHGPIAAVVMERDLGVEDEDVLVAVRDHTFGAADASGVARVLLLADKFETHKRKKDRQLAKIREGARHDIDSALLAWADWKWVKERTSGWQSHPAHWQARREWVRHHHLDRIGREPLNWPAAEPAEA